jgi:hypothetical protein
MKMSATSLGLHLLQVMVLPCLLAACVAQNRSVLKTEISDERYDWKGLLTQSLEFNTFENSFRIATDKQIQTSLAHKSYWHDYLVSLKHYDMDRWGDGDSFIINYVGHPIQGAVSGYIEIQNDPRGRMLEISRSGDYWKSRWKAMLWATVYSTQSEIGPLGESAIGNQGGWSYVSGCPTPCPTYQPGITKYTNNTGWVDFIVTPTVGTLWILAEDFFDRYISDPVQAGDYTRVFPKILRGSLNPARTFSNMLRGQKPWYRDWQHSGVPMFNGIHFTRSVENIEKDTTRSRLEISPHFTLLSIAVNTPSCQNCRQTTSGGGVEVSYCLTRWLDADIDLTRQPQASPLPSDRAGGNLSMGTFGIRTGLDTEQYALKFAVRPGFVKFDKAYLTSPGPDMNETPEVASITHFVWSFSVSGDYRIGRNFALRSTLGNSLVRYRTAEEDPPGTGDPPSWRTHENFINRGNWSFAFGPVLRLGRRTENQSK